MSARDLHLILVGASIALSLAVALQAWRVPHWRRETRLLVGALVACGAAYSLLPLPLGAEWPRELRVLWRVLAAPGLLLLWLVLRALFSERLLPGPMHFLAGALLAGIAALAWLDGASPGLWTRISAGMLAAGGLGFALDWLRGLWSDRHADLDPGRRPLRRLLAAGGAVMVLLALAGALWSLPGRWAVFGSAQLLLQVVAKLGWLWLVARPSGAVVRWLEPEPALPRPDMGVPADTGGRPEARHALDMLAAVRAQQLHRRPGLTIGELAQALKLPEHRLRQLINQELGFRNFNAFLNRLRLDEVAGRLRDPAQDGVAITTIALDAGYASLGPFNRAFRDAHGLTPSEFRRRRGGVAAAEA